MIDLNGCGTCYGYGLWGIERSVPMGPIDASDGLPTIACPECGKSANPIEELDAALDEEDERRRDN